MRNLSKLILAIFALLFNFQLSAQSEYPAVISADKLKVLYLGIDNPVSIAVPGIKSDKIKASITNASITGSNGKYIVRVNKTGEAIIDVTAEINPGEIKKVGSETFIIKRIPSPQLCIGKYYAIDENFNISKAELIKNNTLSVFIDLPFTLRYDIISFSFIYMENNIAITKKINGNTFTEEIINAIKNLKDDGIVFVEQIKIKDTEGNYKLLPSVTIKLKSNSSN